MIKSVDKLKEDVGSLHRITMTVAHRFGVMSESAFREAMKGIISEIFGGDAYRWSVYDSEGFVYGRPAQVEVDIVIRDGKHILVEVKSRAQRSDVLELARIAVLYEKKEGVRPEKAIVAGFVDPDARELAKDLSVRVYTYIEESK